METLTPEEWERRCENAGPRLAKILQRKAAALALQMQSRAVRNATTKPRSRTGHLRRSIAGRVLQSGRTVAKVEGVGSQLAGGGQAIQGAPLSVILSAGGRTGGQNVIYARIQDRGATGANAIRPVNRQWLALPDSSVKTPAGVSRYASPRDYPGKLWFHIIRPGSGKQALAVLLERVGGKNVGRFWLRKEVEIPATRFAFGAWDETRAEVPSRLRDALEVSFKAPSTAAGVGK